MRQASATPRKARPISDAWLERIALHYLDRYGASAEMLRRMLARRVAKRARERGEEPDAFAAAIEETVARAVRAGLIDDARFAAARLATLRRRGTSTRAAGAKLAAKGVSRDVVEAALGSERDDGEEAAVIEEAAARAYAKRRRLGPFRPEQAREANRERDLAALARAGFAYGIARAVIEAEYDDPPA